MDSEGATIPALLQGNITTFYHWYVQEILYLMSDTPSKVL